jgi:uncharacterized protein YndB with AHSA1/START domain
MTTKATTNPPTPTAAPAMEEQVQTLTIRRETLVEASPETVFEVLLAQLGPESEMPDGTPMPLKLEAWPGGRWYRDLGEAGGHPRGHLWGHVQVIKAPTLLELTGPMPMSYPAVNHVQYRLKAEGKATRLTLLHRAMGLIPQEHRDGMPEGWEHGLGRIKAAAERRSRQRG